MEHDGRSSDLLTESDKDFEPMVSIREILDIKACGPNCELSDATGVFPLTFIQSRVKSGYLAVSVFAEKSSVKPQDLNLAIERRLGKWYGSLRILKISPLVIC
jgi:hypothetical protein